MNSSPCQGHGRGKISIADCWIDYDSRESGKKNSYWFKNEPLPVSRTRKGKFQLLYCSDSSGSRKDLCYCRFRVLSSPDCSHRSWFCRILLSLGYWKTMKAAVFSRAFCLFYCQFRKIIFLNGSTESAFWFLYCHFLLSWQSKGQNARYRLSAKLTANSRKEKVHTYDCRPDRQFKRKNPAYTAAQSVWNAAPPVL